MKGHEAVAAAMTDRARRVLSEAALGVEVGIVKTITPTMLIELASSAVVLEVSGDDDDDLKFSQFLQWWDQNYGVRPGDSLLIHVLPGGARVAFDLDTDRPVAAGLKMNRPPATPGGDVRPLQTRSESGLFTIGSVTIPGGGGTDTPVLTWNHHIVAQMEVHDTDGDLVGYIPVFGSLPA